MSSPPKVDLSSYAYGDHGTYSGLNEANRGDSDWLPEDELQGNSMIVVDVRLSESGQSVTSRGTERLQRYVTNDDSVANVLDDRKSTDVALVMTRAGTGGLLARTLAVTTFACKTVVTCKIKHLQNICKNVLVFYVTCNHRKTFAKHWQNVFRGGYM